MEVVNVIQDLVDMAAVYWYQEKPPPSTSADPTQLHLVEVSWWPFS
jgi:hypothetical protein